MTSKRIAVIDYGMGNLHSVASALHQVAPDAAITIAASAAEVDDADCVIFPGVGAIRDCIGEIKRGGFDLAVKRALDAQKPVLAICVGMQSLLTRSEENQGVECLGLLGGRVRFFANNEAFHHQHPAHPSDKLKVPHMGWNRVKQTIAHPLWANIPQSSRFYFVHSYYVELDNPALIAGSTDYGITFTSVAAQKNLFAVQFHPEKSAEHGLQLLKNFVAWDGQL